MRDTDNFVEYYAGEGLLKGKLMELASRLDISWAVHFAGWADSHLPRILAGIDIMVNPSLRGHSETFCIANIEAMAMGIPLVTFAVGGVGEYVDHVLNPLFNSGDVHSVDTTVDVDVSSDGESITQQTTLPFTISTNAAIVNHATPEAIAEAVFYLIRHDDVRESISRAGIGTVDAHFTSERQMRQYRDVYRNIIDKWKK